MSPCVNMCVLLLALIPLLHTGSAAADEKLISCCTVVSRTRIQEPIISARYQNKSGNCREAILFMTESKREFCIFPRAQWVRPALQELKRKLSKAEAQAAAPSTKAPRTNVSLLSIITSSVQPSSTVASSTSSVSPSSVSTSSVRSSSVSPSSSSVSPSSSSLSPSSVSPSLASSSTYATEKP